MAEKTNHMQEQGLSARCPQCGRRAAVDMRALREKGGWTRCSGCMGIFDGFEAMSAGGQGAPARAPQAEAAGSARASGPEASPRRIVPKMAPGLAPAASAPAKPAAGKAPEPAKASLAGPSEIADPEVQARFSGESMELAAAAAAKARAVAAQPSLARARVLAVPDPAKNKPALDEGLPKAIGAKEALRLAAAKREDPWSRREARMGPKRAAAWCAGVAALSLALACQVLWAERAQASARWPLAKAALAAACSRAGCSVGLPQARSALELEGAEVRQDAQGNLVFTGSLRSSSEWASSAPMLRLTIEGEGGEPLASRVYEPKQWLGAESIAPGEAIEARMDLAYAGKPTSGFKAALEWSQPR